MHTRVGEGGASFTPSKNFKKFGHKNVNNKKIGDILDFLTAPSNLLKRI
jgi:hypothetical protein